MRGKVLYSVSLLALAVLLSCSQAVWANSSGLNNIPTTDVVPENVLVFQEWLNSAANTKPSEYVGFKYGLSKDVEIGVDWKANGPTHGHAMLQAKWAFDIDGNEKWRGVLGFADLSDNRVDNGEFLPFTATSYDLGYLRLHLGYAAQPHNERFFAGIDKTVTFLDRNLMLKGDAIQFNDKEEVLYSAGFLYELGNPDTSADGLLDRLFRNVILESWISMPSNNDPEVYTVKLNYVIKF